MTSRKDFIDLEIVPGLGGFEDDFDLDGICDETTEWDPIEGYVWKEEYADPDDLDAYWEAVRRYDRTAQNQL